MAQPILTRNYKRGRYFGPRAIFATTRSAEKCSRSEVLVEAHYRISLRPINVKSCKNFQKWRALQHDFSDGQAEPAFLSKGH